ncbi:Na(+)/H(+) exchange regulatory cofactor NHE-RF1 [Bacillus rossius redtenbacheri]|uniref:Na(+)/H(+) exchange regulatory cofactor NHE-RF1 n=1 Tax=Bacillus rossius redtenbacheri TaxID=93214 RepID=UPI002FDE0024
MMSNGALSGSLPVARFCHIIQVKTFDGYGFNLHAEKNKPGQFIGKVDEGSPAEAAGLKEGDRIIEVNGVSIVNENHKQVVQRIKSIPNETKLLVVDAEADSYYKTNDIPINGNLSNILYLKTPVPNDSDPENADEDRDKNLEDVQSQKSGELGISGDQDVSGFDDSAATTPFSERKISQDFHGDSANMGDSSLESNASEDKTLEHNNSLNLSMTAKELRAQLASRKKYDPKKESMDFKKKFDIVQKL